MALAERQQLIKRVQGLRKGRVLVTFFNFDRPSHPTVPGLMTQFSSDTKEALFRVLKESVQPGQGIDLCVYTRGGDTNAVWPLVSLLREYDPDFEVLVPFRCHSSGTLLALGARRIVMGALSELSPIDPSTGNQFNPPDPNNPSAKLAISVEDVQAFREFALDQFSKTEKDEKKRPENWREYLQPFLDTLSRRVHPLALGNVHRVYRQIQQLAEKLLALHGSGEDHRKTIEALTTRFYSHLHMINRHEAQSILGTERIEFCSEELSSALDDLLGGYKKDFQLYRPFFVASHMGDDPAQECRFFGGAIESESWAYGFVTNVRIRQFLRIPPNVQIQMPPQQQLPMMPGVPRDYHFELLSQSWDRNTEPLGVTV